MGDVWRGYDAVLDRPVAVKVIRGRPPPPRSAGGWCTDALVDESGFRCMRGSLRAEAGGDRGLEADAAAVLLDAIRREFGDDVDSVPSFNDAWGDDRVPFRMVDQAAHLADARGL